MSRVLAYTSPARGHLYPVVPILAELGARGHHTILYGLSGELDPLRSLGIEAYAIDPPIEDNQIVDWRERLAPRAAASVLHTFAQRSELEVPDLERAIAEHHPEALLIDINCWGAGAVAEASELPWAIYSPYLLPLRSRVAPPFGLGLRPLGGPLGRVRDAFVAKAADVVFQRAALPSLGPLRRGRGVSEVHNFDELLRRVPLLLGLTAEGFEYARPDWPACVRLVGPMNWSPPQPPPASLGELGDPLALVTCSTERQRDKRLLQVALDGLPGAGISVFGTSAAHDPSTFDPPAGSRVVRFASHDPLLDRAVCVVCHGGLGITQKALAAGVPVVVVPFGRDQMETARRVEMAQAGVRLSLRHLTSSRLTQAVKTAIELRAGAEGVARAFAAAGGPAAAADALEALIAISQGDQTRRSLAGRPNYASRATLKAPETNRNGAPP